MLEFGFPAHWSTLRKLIFIHSIKDKAPDDVPDRAEKNKNGEPGGDDLAEKEG